MEDREAGQERPGGAGRPRESGATAPGHGGRMSRQRKIAAVALPRKSGQRYAAIGTASICSGVLYPIAE